MKATGDEQRSTSGAGHYAVRETQFQDLRETGFFVEIPYSERDYLPLLVLLKEVVGQEDKLLNLVHALLTFRKQIITC